MTELHPPASHRLHFSNLGPCCPTGKRTTARCYPTSRVRGSAWGTPSQAGWCSCASGCRSWQWPLPETQPRTCRRRIAARGRCSRPGQRVCRTRAPSAGASLRPGALSGTTGWCTPRSWRFWLGSLRHLLTDTSTCAVFRWNRSGRALTS